MNYYVSYTDGNDSNAGTSKSAPFKTTAKINALGASNVLKGGDIVQFKCGDTFPGGYLDFDTSAYTQSIEFSTYGSGAKPVFDMYKYILPTATWVLYDTNIWQLDLRNTANYTGNTYDTRYHGANVGSLKIDGVFLGRKYATLTQLQNSVTQWDFWCDDNQQYLYVKSFGSPSSISPSPEIAVSIEGTSSLSINAWVDYYDLEIKGHGGVSVNIGDKDSTHLSTNVSCNNLTVREGGGSTLIAFIPNPDIRYGTGIQLYGGGDNCKIEGCYIEEIYEAAMTLQAGAGGRGFKNISFKNNRCNKVSQAFEIWSQEPTSYFQNIKFQHNTCDLTGYDSRHFQHTIQWSGDTEYFDQRLGVNLLLYNTAVDMTDIEISENKFYMAQNGHIWLDADTNPAHKVNSHDNDIYLLEGQKLVSSKYTANAAVNNLTVEQFATFVANTGMEKNTRWYRIPATTTTVEDVLKADLVAVANLTAQSFADNHAARQALSLGTKANNILGLLPNINTIVARNADGSISQPGVMLNTLTNGFDSARGPGINYKGDGTSSLTGEPFTNFNGSAEYFGGPDFGFQIAMKFDGTTYIRQKWYTNPWTDWKIIENAKNKATDFTVLNDTLYPSVLAVNTAITAAKVGLWNDRGAYNPTTTSNYPASGGSGASGAIKKGDIWTISVAGTVGSAAVDVGDTVRAIIDSPGTTAANWAIMEHNLGYTPVNTADVSTAATANKIVKRGSSGEIAQAGAIMLSSLGSTPWNDAKLAGVAYQADGTVSLANEPSFKFNGICQYFGTSDLGFQKAVSYSGAESYERMFWYTAGWGAWKQIVFV